MNPGPGSAAQVEQQMRALIELVETDRDRLCAQTLGEARARAAALRAKAHAEAVARVRAAYAEQRQRCRERVAAARSRLATLRRLQAQQRTAALLRLAWEQLPAELTQLWRQAPQRAAWVARVLAGARAHLGDPAGVPWRIVHAPDWPAAERQALAAALAAAVSLEADATIGAGLKVISQGNVVDGTLGGLLADRAEIEARLLRQLESAA